VRRLPCVLAARQRRKAAAPAPALDVFYVFPIVTAKSLRSIYYRKCCTVVEKCRPARGARRRALSLPR
jgi:hypothetical protein